MENTISKQQLLNLPNIKKVNLSNYEEMYWDKYRGIGTLKINDNSLGSAINYVDVFYSNIMYDEESNLWLTFIGPHEDYVAGKTVAESIENAYNKIKGTLRREITRVIDDPNDLTYGQSPDYNLIGEFNYMGSAVEDLNVNYNATSLEDGDWFNLYFVDYGHVDGLRYKYFRENSK